jgi:hypothetical protein
MQASMHAWSLHLSKHFAISPHVRVAGLPQPLAINTATSMRIR